MSTLFHKIINKEIPADIVYEDEISLAFKDINPVAPQHILIIPKEDIPTANDITPENSHIVGHLFVVAAKLAKQLGIAEDGYRLVVNCNQAAGQTVYQLHIHLIAGQILGWPPFADTKPKQI